MTTLKILLILIICTVTGCGTLGGFDVRNFDASKQSVAQAIDTIFAKYPEFKVPDKWMPFDDWKERGYDFLDSRLFYFRSGPEEMYYVTFVGDSINNYKSGYTSLSIRAVNKGNEYWKLEDQTSSSEKKRIQYRFDKEIISKIEQYTHSKAVAD